MNNRWRAVKRYKKGRSIELRINSPGGFISSTEDLMLATRKAWHHPDLIRKIIADKSKDAMGCLRLQSAPIKVLGAKSVQP